MKYVKTYVFIVLLSVSTHIYAETPEKSLDAPTTLKSNIEHVVLTIGIGTASTNYGLRSISLTTTGPMMLREPDAQWPDGSLVTAASTLTKEQMNRAILLVYDLGLFENSIKSYSERTPVTDSTPPPPKDAKDRRKLLSNEQEPIDIPNISLQFSTFDTHWYSYYDMLLPWDVATKGYMTRIFDSVSGDARMLIESLLKEIKGVQQAP